MQRIHRHALFAAFALATAALTATGIASQDPPKPPKKPQDDAQYVGARVCRNCHRNEAKGNQYTHWGTETPHVNAFKTLASEKSKKIAAEMGIEDPQKAPECLKCHVTAHGVDEKKIDKTFLRVKHSFGVQCESCHGPGSAHKNLRTRAAARQDPPKPGEVITLDIPPGEIALPDEATCVACHNPESPTYKPYDHKTFLAKVAHPNPMRKKNQEPPKEDEGDDGEDGR